MHENSLLLFERFARPHFESGMRVLEIGALVPSAFEQSVGNRAIRWETLDISSTPRRDYLAEDPYSFPIPEETFDIVFAANVIEHVKEIWRWFGELARVCKTGGLVITISPINWGFHEYPVDCWRPYPEGLRTLHEYAGLETALVERRSLESARDRLNWRGLKWLLKSVLRRPLGGKPLFPVDTIAVGRKKPRGLPGT